VAKGYPDYYYPPLIERGISDIRGISPLVYTQFKLYYGYADGAILAEKPWHARWLGGYRLEPPETYVWYDKLTDEIFEITTRLDMVIIGLFTLSVTIAGYVMEAGQNMFVEPYFIFRVDKVNKFTVTCYKQEWTETTLTLKRHAGKYNISEPIHISEGSIVDIRFGFRYMTGVPGSIAWIRLNFDLYEEDTFIQLPVKAIKPVE